jgi:hypothetical protein
MSAALLLIWSSAALLLIWSRDDRLTPPIVVAPALTTDPAPSILSSQAPALKQANIGIAMGITGAHSLLADCALRLFALARSLASALARSALDTVCCCDCFGCCQ